MGAHPAPVIAHAAPVIAHRAPVVAHAAPVIAHPAPVVAHAAPVFAHPAPVIAHAAPVIAHRAPVIAHPAPVIAHAAPVIAHPAPVIAHPAPAYPEVEEPYTYQYGVADDYSNARFNAAETADANGVVSGEYSVALPDGRTQIVKYTSDNYNGYVADVSYEGVPVYPEAKPYVPAPAPAYHA